MSDKSANRNKGCVHPHRGNICAIRKRSPSALGGTAGTGMKTEAMVSRAHSHGPSELSASPELLVVPSGR